MIAALAMAAALTLDEPCNFDAFVAKPEALTLYRVKTPGRTYFANGFKGEYTYCEDERSCATQAYLIAGDVVLVSHQKAGRACAWFKPAAKPRKRGTRTIDPIKSEAPSTQGWLPMARLEPVDVPRGRPASAWDGEWVGEAELIDIRPQGEARLKVEGSALFAHDREGVEQGAINTGEIEGVFFREGDVADGISDFDGRFRRTTAKDWGDSPEDCAVRLRLVGPYLLAQDNYRCGGLNVTFSGLYRR